jgi:hypothetical protein
MPRNHVFHGPEAIFKHLPPHRIKPSLATPRMAGYPKTAGMQDSSVMGASAPHLVQQIEFPPDTPSLSHLGSHASMPHHYDAAKHAKG